MRVDWSPYSDGRWIWTSHGWYWHSYEPFGYITYHYGRWYFDDYYGWLWYPDYEWAPAWVEWRYDNNYIGWAPLHPYALFSISVGIYYTTAYYAPYYHWNFVVYNNFYNPHIYNYCVEPRYKYRVHSGTRYRNNYSYRNGRVRNNGVDVSVVRTRSGQTIRERDLTSVTDPGSLHNRKIGDKSKIRTFYKSRDELLKREVKDMKIERSDRKSSLDVTKIKKRELQKKDNNISKDKKRTKQVTTKEKQKDRFTKTDRTKTNKDKKVKTSDNRKKSGNDVFRTKKKTEQVNKNNQKKTVIKKNEKKTDVKRSNNNYNKNTRVKKNTDQKKLERKVTNNNKRNVITKTNKKQKKQIKKNTSNDRNKKTVTTKKTVKKNNRKTVKKNSGNNNKKNRRSRR
jgi:hypothetical protein